MIMVKEIGHFIGGKRVVGKSGRFGDIFNPNTGEISARVALASGCGSFAPPLRMPRRRSPNGRPRTRRSAPA